MIAGLMYFQIYSRDSHLVDRLDIDSLEAFKSILEILTMSVMTQTLPGGTIFQIYSRDSDDTAEWKISYMK